MKVLITGSNSQLARALVPLLDNKVEFMPMGRQSNNIPWTLGICPDPDVISKNSIKACIHFAWSMNDRLNDSHLNIGGTGQLSAWCDEAKIPFLFISSSAVEGKSAYGRSKLQAERYVQENHGYVIRPGLVIESNKYVGTKRKFFQVIPTSEVTAVPINTLSDVSKAIDSWLNNVATNKKLSDLDLPKRSVHLSDLFDNRSKISVHLPLHFIELLLRKLAPVSLLARNYLDSLDSLKRSRGE